MGFEVQGGYALLEDNTERLALENWKDSKSGLFSPVYPELIENEMTFAVNVIYTPFYAKQLTFLSLIANFDVYVSAGLGFNKLTYYPSVNWKKQDTENPPPINEDGTINEEMVGYEDPSKYGVAGRSYMYSSVSKSYDQFAPSVNIGLGQRYFFLKRMNLKIEFKDNILFVSRGSADMWIVNNFIIWSGLGIIF